MPELPEVEVVSRLIGEAVVSSRVRACRVPAVNALKSFDPPLETLNGRKFEQVGRRGKQLLIRFEGGIYVLIHLMSAGRLQLYDKKAGPKDRTSRLLIELEDGRELRLREFGTRQSAWLKVLDASSLEQQESLMALGPDAWPDPPPFSDLLMQARPLHALLRDQRVIAGIGRSWADEILHCARLSPFKRGRDLTNRQALDLREATVSTLGSAIEHYLRVLSIPIPDKLPMPLQIHRHQGSACPRCGRQLQAVHFEDHQMCYCPGCQTGGKVLKDRRLSRLLK